MTNKKQILDLNSLIPSSLQNETLTSLVSNTFNRFLSEEQSVLVNGRVGTPVAGEPTIQAENLERKLNALIPAISYKIGSEEVIFTFEDIINRLENLGVDINTMRDWLKEQFFNFTPPIDYDKFINFSNYYWVGKQVAPNNSWNPENDPEYYVMRKHPSIDPADYNDWQRSNMWVHISDFYGADLANTIEVQGSNYNQTMDPASSFIKVNGIKINHVMTRGHTVAVFNDSTLELESIRSYDTYGNVVTPGINQMIADLQEVHDYKIVVITSYDATTVNTQLRSYLNSIFRTTSSAIWVPSRMSHIIVGQKNGSLVPYEQFSSTETINSGTIKISGTSIFCNLSSGSGNGTSCDITSAIQATRPIIQYHHTLEMNAFVENGVPSNAGTPYVQTKFKFNQLPQFNLYRYDGTHSGHTSGLFFYQENSNSPIDEALKRRIVRDVNADFIFSIGMKDEKGRLLYYKDSEQGLCSVWRAGPTTPHSSPIKFTGGAGKGSLAINEFGSTPDNQDWTITAVDATTFTVYGNRSGNVGFAQVGQPFICDDITFTISSSSIDFEEGDAFHFSVSAPVSPRYVHSPDNSSVINYPGGPALDTDKEGCWLVPLRMFQNLSRETRDNLAFADILVHMRNVLRRQDGFEGASFGVSNSRNLDINYGLGGSIRDFSSNFPLLASMLMQQDVSPLSILDFLESSNNTALASIDQFILDGFLEGFAAAPWTDENAIYDPSSPIIQHLKSYLESLRGQDENLNKIFHDSTSGVKNWPVGLNGIGMPLGASKIEPRLAFDPELGIEVIQHHDGHISVAAKTNSNLDLQLVQTKITRSSGELTAGIISETEPTNPYARQLWYQPSNRALYFFNVDYDTQSPPASVAPSASFWFRRGLGELYEWDSVSSKWVRSSSTISSRWTLLRAADIRNSLILAIEKTLFDNIPKIFDTPENAQFQLSRGQGSQYDAGELVKFANKYGYDVYAPDYVAADPYTWNYSDVYFSDIADVPARWYDVYKKYFNRTGSLSTCRPNLEPWKLLGFANKPSAYTYNGVTASWDAHFAALKSQLDIAIPTTPLSAQLVTTANVPLSGLANIDGKTVSSGDVILVTGQSVSSQNGLYTATAASWSRVSIIISTGLIVQVSSGDEYANTYWIATTAAGSTSFDQIRLWSNDMWDHIKAQRPGLKLCVNPRNDSLVPPYVAQSSGFISSEALRSSPLTAEESRSLSNSYQLGDNGPVELIWKKSLEYRYALARNCFRLFPLEFLDKTWGYTYFKLPSSTRVERNLGALLPASSFLLHGERLHNIQMLDENDCADRVQGTLAKATAVPSAQRIDIQFTVSEVTNNQTFCNVLINSVFNSRIKVNQSFTLSHPLLQTASLTFMDKGIPYELGDSLKITLVDGATNYQFFPATKKIFVGLGQGYTHLLRYNTVDTGFSSETSAYRNWDLKLAYRAGGLIREDVLTVDTTQGVLPQTAYNVVLKRSTKVESNWLTALRIQLVDLGSLTDLNGQFTRRVTPDGLIVPSGDASTWVFRIEGYNPRNPFIEYYEYDENAGHQTFYVLDRRTTPTVWKKYTQKTSLVRTTLPLVVTGLQEVINVIYGYLDKLEEDHWNFSSSSFTDVDAETGRSINWQLEIEKLVNRVYQGMDAGDAYVINPFMPSIVFDTPRGIASRFTETTFSDIYTTQAVFDVSGTIVPISNLHVVRTDDSIKISSKTPIFSAHLFTDEFEHVVLFNQRVTNESSSNKIFDPFLGIQIDSAYFNFYRQAERNRKPSFGGFYLNGNSISRNILSSVNSIGTYYDSTRALDQPLTAEHSLALLGFSQKPYFNNISSDISTQFNFWRGLIQAKGTNMTVDAFVNYKKFLDASVDEYWAYKIAEYGDAREKTFPELKINASEVNQAYTKFQFYSPTDTAYSPLALFNQISSADDTRWFSIDDLGTELRFETSPIEETFTVAAGTSFPAYISLRHIFSNDDAGQLSSVTGPGNPILVNSRVVKVSAAGTYTVKGYSWMTPSKLSPIKLFDYRESQLVKEIGLWHPAAGIHAASALSTVNITGPRDPALYTYSTQSQFNPNLRVFKPWASREVGKVWWDTSNLDYIPYYDTHIFPNREEREARWGSLAEWASVDLYQWTESPVHPSKYDALASSEEGNLEIDRKVRLSGKVGKPKYYARDRIIKLKPIAWSKTGVGAQVAHPSFGPARFTKVYASAKELIVDTGRLAAIDLTEGRHFGAWKLEKPYGEVVIGSNVGYEIGSSTSLTNPVYTVSGVLSSVKLEPMTDSLFGTRIGAIQILKKIYKERSLQVSGDTVQEALINKYALRMIDSTGYYQDVAVEDWFSNSLSTDNTIRYEFSDFGLSLSVQRSEASMIPQPVTPPPTQAWVITTVVAVASKTVEKGTSVSFIPVTASGGKGALRYQISPALPAGLSFVEGSGQVTGTPTAVLASTTFTVTVSDTATDIVSQPSSKTFTLEVTSAAPPPGPGPSFVTSNGSRTVEKQPNLVELGWGDGTLYIGTVGANFYSSGTVKIDLGANTQMPVTYITGYRPNSSADWVFDTPIQTSNYSNSVDFPAATAVNGAQYYVQVRNQGGSISSGILTISNADNTGPVAPPGPGPSFVTNNGSTTTVVSPTNIQLGFGPATINFTSAAGSCRVNINLGANTQMPVTYKVAYRPNSSADWVFSAPAETSSYTNYYDFTAAAELNGAQYYIQVSNSSGSVTTGILTIFDSSDGSSPPPAPPPAPTPPPGPGPSFVTSNGTSTVVVSPVEIQLGYQAATMTLPSTESTGLVHLNLGANTQMPVSYVIYFRPNPDTAWLPNTPVEISTYNNTYYVYQNVTTNGSQYYVDVQNSYGSTSSGILTIYDLSDSASGGDGGGI